MICLAALFIPLVVAHAHAEPFRATATLTGGLADNIANVDLASDYGIVRHFAVTGEVGLRADGGHSLGAGALIFPVDARWGRLGIALIPEIGDPFTSDGKMQGRVGVRGSWLAFWGVGLGARADVVLSPTAAPILDWGLGLSMRM